MYHNQQSRKSQLQNHPQSPNFLENYGILEKNYEPKEHVSTTTGENITKNIIGTDSNYKKNNTNVHCWKTSNEDNLVRTQFEKNLCDKHHLNLWDSTINSFLYCFRNSMYNGYPRNKNNFLNKHRNETGLCRPKYKGCKTLIMYKEETDNKKVTYKGNFLSEIGHNCGPYSTHQN